MSLKAFSESGKCPPSPECIKACVLELSSSYDKEYGGFGNAPKFPQPGKIFLSYKYFLIFQPLAAHCPVVLDIAFLLNMSTLSKPLNRYIITI